MFSNGQFDPSFVGYIDSYNAGDINHMRSTTWYVFTHVGGLIR